MKNGKYVLNYQHVCFEAPRLCFPICLIHIHPRLSVFITGQKAEHTVKKKKEKNEEEEDAVQSLPILIWWWK